MDRGYLVISVTGGGVAMPILGAHVEVFVRKYRADGTYDSSVALADIQNGRFTDDYATDAVGKTPQMVIETPDIDASFTEGGNTPYSIADVYVEKSGYFGALFLGVQIFPKRESILPVNLEPYVAELVNNGSVTYVVNGNYTFVYTIPAPEAGGKRENAEGSEDDAVRPFVAEEVYVPENITVHLGRPSESAENVTVTFQDYIKNVASSEIFPTWPESAIRANIYAQISIALNRIYTEWYPSRGFPFQITNSTAFDQAFVNGRNIYDNIERIVDEIFNTYIRRTGFEEPLFATYCDGIQTNCSGMTQWGSFELANQGYSPIAILRYYYGENIELVTTDNIRGIESTYGGIPLSLGSVGDDVAVIQRQLNRIRNDYPRIPFIISTNGVFGSGTDSSVRQFQDIFNLAVDGVVGKATWYKASLVYVSVKRLGELTSEGQSSDFRVIDASVVLGRGSSGDDVRVLQYLLEYISVFYNNVQPLTVDGIFGNGTYVSLLSFQQAFGLELTGTTTEQTWYTLYGVFEAIQKTVLPVGEGQTFPGILQQGDSGENVRLLQRYLNAISVYYGDIPRLSEDGVFGSQTRNAVAEFQRLYLFSDTGVVDSATWYRIVELYNYISNQQMG
ncbi:MAG: peptidoglycan-binding protein [Clostridia bacterium]|nr:peptidoglycan-binding protein [Clostridia bacterium]